MRYKDFAKDLSERFDLTAEMPAENLVWVRALANAITDAQQNGESTFRHPSGLYKITATWQHGCINYDCNPATCWVDWTLTSEDATE